MGIANIAALLACGIAMGLGALGSGWGLGHTAQGALRAVARQPAKTPDIFRNMLVGQAITETPAIFSLVVSFLLYFSVDKILEAPNSPAQAAAFLGAGLCIGVGAIGSGIGSGLVAREALEGLSRNPASHGQVLMLMLVGQAWVQTGVIFALVVSLFLLNSGSLASLSSQSDYHLFATIPLSGGELVAAARFIGSGFAMGFGAIGSALGIAYVGGMACRSLADYPAASGRIKAAYFIGSAITETPAIFSLVIALILLLKG